MTVGKIRLPHNPWASAALLALLFAVVTMTTGLGLLGTPTRDGVIFQAGMLAVEVIFGCVFVALWALDDLRAARARRAEQGQRS
ncbi:MULTISPECIES: hypothetical protein [unclassified Microbacterium]|uniref:hypothetical protein n=1 Tax=unclassified Microbacterium TaxID=2609290 RepID=UPI003018A9FC